jgi:hypothetical protein
MKIHVYVRGTTSEGTERIEKMMKAAEIKDWNIIDLNSIELHEMPEHIGIAFGKVTGRLAAEYTPYLHVLPHLDRLAPGKVNYVARTNAWATLKDIKLEAEGLTLLSKIVSSDDDNDDWMWAILKKGNQRICIYKGPKPKVQADAFINRNDISTLLKLTEIFKADIVLLEKES